MFGSFVLSYYPHYSPYTSYYSRLLCISRVSRSQSSAFIHNSLPCALPCCFNEFSLLRINQREIRFEKRNGFPWSRIASRALFTFASDSAFERFTRALMTIFLRDEMIIRHNHREHVDSYDTDAHRYEETRFYANETMADTQMSVEN